MNLEIYLQTFANKIFEHEDTMVFLSKTMSALQSFEGYFYNLKFILPSKFSKLHPSPTSNTAKLL